MNKKIRNILLAGLTLLALDRGTSPIIDRFVIYDILNPNTPKKMDAKKYEYVYDEDEKTASLKYLKLAHAITMKYLDIKSTIYLFSPTEDVLELKRGDCFETSKFTYSNYLFLINEAKKPELSKYVRLASGDVKFIGGGGGHNWLEFSKNGSWIPYETTANDLEEITKINPSSIDSLVPSLEVLERKSAKYNRTSFHQISQDGKMRHGFDIKGVIKSPGFSYLLIKRLQY